jgi:hypothetical protein
MLLAACPFFSLSQRERVRVRAFFQGLGPLTPRPLPWGEGAMALDREVAAIHHQFSARDVGGFV